MVKQSISPNKSNKQKSIIKQTKTKKKYLTKKGLKLEELNQNWEVKRILDVRLRTKTQQQKKITQKIKSQQKSSNYIKEYLIEWIQTQKDPWENTWQPQQCIPVQTRLDYLSRRNIQQKMQYSRIKRFFYKTELNEHTELETQRRFVNKIDTENVIKQRQKKQEKKYATKKFISYLGNQEEFAKLIENFLNGKKNSVQDHEDKKKQTNNLIKEQNTNSGNIDNKNIIKQQYPSNKQIENNEQELSSEVQQQVFPLEISSLLIDEILGLQCQKNKQNYFRVKLRNQPNTTLIAEEDIMKYFPYQYYDFINKQTQKQMYMLKSALQQDRIDQDELFEVFGLNQMFNLDELQLESGKQQKEINKRATIMEMIMANNQEHQPYLMLDEIKQNQNQRKCIKDVVDQGNINSKNIFEVKSFPNCKFRSQTNQISMKLQMPLNHNKKQLSPKKNKNKNEKQKSQKSQKINLIKIQPKKPLQDIQKQSILQLIKKKQKSHKLKIDLDLNDLLNNVQDSNESKKDIYEQESR